MFNPIFSFHKQPSFTLVGAGPGDPELITLKAIKALEAADIALFCWMRNWDRRGIDKHSGRQTDLLPSKPSSASRSAQ